MTLPQTLQPGEKGTPLFENGIFQGYENIYIPTDEQLADEAKAKEVKLIIEQLPDKGINKAWKRLLEKGILP